MAYIEDTHQRTQQYVSQLTDAQLEAIVTARGGRQMTGTEAMMSGFAHAYRHVGNILDARHLGGFETHALG